MPRVSRRARNDIERERSPDRMPQVDGENAMRFLDFWQSDIEVASTPREQGQIVLFMRDLRKHLTAP